MQQLKEWDRNSREERERERERAVELRRGGTAMDGGERPKSGSAAQAATANERATSADTNSPRTAQAQSVRRHAAVSRGRWAEPRPHHAMEAEGGREGEREREMRKGVRRRGS